MSSDTKNSMNSFRPGMVPMGQRFGIVAVDVHRQAVGAQVVAGLLGVVGLFLVIGAFGGSQVQVVGAGFLAACFQNLDVEHFARAVLGARDEGEDVLRGKRGIHFVPRLVGVRNQRAVLHDIGRQRVEPLGRGKGEFGAVHLGGEDDAVIADADFHDFRDAVGVAQVDVRLRDARGGVGDVDGGFAQAFAQLLATRA